MQKATYAAGCFWGVQAEFDTITGVLESLVGYSGGTTQNPTYEEVCTGKTGHAESVQLTFDTIQITYEELLDVFWRIHDPTTLNRQGPDGGTQYRSIIFYHTNRQKEIAVASKKKRQQTLPDDTKIVTEIIPAQLFYPAEEYHQKYFQKKKQRVL